MGTSSSSVFPSSGEGCLYPTDLLQPWRGAAGMFEKILPGSCAQEDRNLSSTRGGLWLAWRDRSDALTV